MKRNEKEVVYGRTLIEGAGCVFGAAVFWILSQRLPEWMTGMILVGGIVL